MKIQRMMILLALVSVVAGCSAPESGGPTKEPESPPAEVLSPVPIIATPDPKGPAGEPVLAAAVTEGRALFPTTDLEVSYRFADDTRSREFLIPDGERLVQTYNGVPYITWFFTPEGVFRPDTSDPDGRHLVRYLPAHLEDGLVWTHQGVADTYRFRLSARERCEGEGVTFHQCWSLEVVGLHRVSTFFFAPGMGVIRAIGDDEDATESFDKRLTGHAVASLPTPDRQGYLDRGLAPPEAIWPEAWRVGKGRADDFQAFLDRHNERPRCGTPSDGTPVLPGARGRITFLCGGKLWSLDLADGKQTVLYAHPPGIWSYTWEPHGRGIGLVVQPRGDLIYWEANGGTVRRMRTRDRDLIPSVDWSSDGNILVASLGTSPYRAYQFFDPSTGEAIGGTSGMGLRWSLDGRRFAVERGDVGVAPESPGRTLIVGELVGGNLSERVIGAGSQTSDFRVIRFAADGTLMYRESAPMTKENMVYWALPPGPDGEPMRLEPSSALVHEVESPGPTGEMVGDERIRRLGDSADGAWTLFLFSRYGEIYLIKSDLTGPFARVPGSFATWDPR